ncbi:MAG: hypothetical protein JNL26_18375 [Gemmatimonadetes bacterium]|nr:hypothetical protein [Gemmatimonadota bacterium]
MRTTILTLVLCLAQVADAQPSAVTPRGYLATSDMVVVAFSTDAELGASSALVIRRPTSPSNVVLLRRDAQPEHLAIAMAAVIQARRERGDILSREERARIGPGFVRSSPPSRRAMAAATRDLALLRRAPTLTVPGLGDAQALIVNARVQLEKH